MFTCIYLLIIVNSLLSVSTETHLELEVVHQLELLEEKTYFPVEIYLEKLTSQLESLITNFSNYEIEVIGLIESHTRDVKDDVEAILETFNRTGVSTTCQEHIRENFAQVLKSGLGDAKEVLVDGISRAQRGVVDARNVFMTAQNRTAAVKLEVQRCMQTVENSECLLGALGTILLLERTLPKVVAVAAEHHDTQLQLLEEEVVAEFTVVVVESFDRCVELLDGFLECVTELR